MEQLEWRDQIVTKMEAAEGAEEVLFNWSGAQGALDDIDAAVDDVGTEQDDRFDAVTGVNGAPGLGSWVGPYRNDFDAATATHDGAAVTLKTQLEEMGDAIFDCGRVARDEQVRRNEEAASEAAETPLSTSTPPP